MKVDFSKRPLNLDMKIVNKGNDGYVYCESNYEEVRDPNAIFLGECETQDEAWNLVKKHLEANNLGYSYYYRCNYYGNLIEIDYGSWTYFAYIYDLPEKERELIKLSEKEFGGE